VSLAGVAKLARREGLKNPWGQPHPGSIPGPGIMMVLAVAAGGALGATARYLIAEWTRGVSAATTIVPVTTLGINVVGSFVLGAVVATPALSASVAPSWRAFVAIGLCGGFTTFSAFSGEVVELVQRGALGRAAVYALVSVVLCVLAFTLGLAVARGASRS
jgi:fluoride exporter